jgi:UDP-N-acetylmuramoyl-tripeptide--D-alanyl-D-alanine ligase
MLYTALRGAHYDGHSFVEQAFSAGAVAAMVDQLPEVPTGKPLLQVANVHHALLKLAGAYRDQLSGVFIAVTGSVGKTTVKELCADILARSAACTRTPGNWNNDIGLPLSLLAMERDDQYGVFEIGMNHPGEIEPLTQLLRPQYGIITAVGPVHMAFFKSVEDIAREKASMLTALSPQGCAVLDVDSPWYTYLRKYAVSKVVTVSAEGDPNADYRITHKVIDAGVCHVREKATGAMFRIQMPFGGAFIIHDVLLAVALARILDIPVDEITRAVRAYRPVGMRWQRLAVSGIEVINDAYNANPMSMRAALSSAAQTAVTGKRWLALGAMLELGDCEEDEHRLLGQQLAGRAWHGLVVVGAQGRIIADAARHAGFPEDRIFQCETPGEAGRLLRKQLNPGDQLLIKASRSVQMEKILPELADNDLQDGPN